ncbi:hypothetical protein D3C87_1156960 [compost metagenome]
MPALREAAAREVQRAVMRDRDRRAHGSRLGRRHAQRLEQRGDGLALRILMEQRPAKRIERGIFVVGQQRDAAQQAVQYLRGVLLHARDIGQHDFPALVRADAVRVEPFVGAIEQRRLASHRQPHPTPLEVAHATQAPPFGMPGNVTECPQWRIAVVLTRDHPTLAGLAERRQPRQRAVARLHQRLRQPFARQPARVSPRRLAASEVKIGKHGEAAHRQIRDRR